MSSKPVGSTVVNDFNFKRKTKKIDWNLVNTGDESHLDIDSLKPILDNIIYSQIRQEDIQYMPEPLQVKLFKTLQMSLEFMSFEQGVLEKALIQVEMDYKKSYEHCKKADQRYRSNKKRLEELTKDYTSKKAQVANAHIAIIQNTTNSVQVGTCPFCEECYFKSKEMLKNHINSLHMPKTPNPETNENNNILNHQLKMEVEKIVDEKIKQSTLGANTKAETTIVNKEDNKEELKKPDTINNAITTIATDKKQEHHDIRAQSTIIILPPPIDEQSVAIINKSIYDAVNNTTDKADKADTTEIKDMNEGRKESEEKKKENPKIENDNEKEKEKEKEKEMESEQIINEEGICKEEEKSQPKVISKQEESILDEAKTTIQIAQPITVSEAPITKSEPKAEAVAIGTQYINIQEEQGRNEIYDLYKEAVIAPQEAPYKEHKEIQDDSKKESNYQNTIFVKRSLSQQIYMDHINNQPTYFQTETSKKVKELQENEERKENEKQGTQSTAEKIEFDAEKSQTNEQFVLYSQRTTEAKQNTYFIKFEEEKDRQNDVYICYMDRISPSTFLTRVIQEQKQVPASFKDLTTVINDPTIYNAPNDIQAPQLDNDPNAVTVYNPRQAATKEEQKEDQKEEQKAEQNENNYKIEKKHSKEEVKTIYYANDAKQENSKEVDGKHNTEENKETEVGQFEATVHPNKIEKSYEYKGVPTL